MRPARLAVIRDGRVLAETAPKVTALSLPGRPATLDPARYAPAAED
jgi:cytosine deaminase